MLILENQPDKMDLGSDYGVPEDESRLEVVQCSGGGDDIDAVVIALKNDQVALVRGLDQANADAFLSTVTAQLGLQEQLALQTGFASIRGHRENVGKHFMTVNRRADYHFIPCHSEGSHAVGMQLAAFYCHENTTDGGATVLMNVDSTSPHWQKQRELVTRVDLGGTKPSRGDVARAKVAYGINILEDLIQPADQIVKELPSAIPGVRVLLALTPARKAYSAILDRHVHAYWDTVASVDFDSGKEYMKMLQACGLLKVPQAGADIAVLDNAHERRVWSSGVDFESLFKAKLTHKLAPGELVILNNTTWTHSTSNWTPGSGVRNVVGAFA
jgi:hypothetical protein